jgi:hypothetical protein
MRFEIEEKIVINVDSSNLMHILRAFLLCLGPLFEKVVSQIVLHYSLILAVVGIVLPTTYAKASFKVDNTR